MKDCFDEYDKDEYLLLEGEHVVKVVVPQRSAGILAANSDL